MQSFQHGDRLEFSVCQGLYANDIVVWGTITGTIPFGLCVTLDDKSLQDNKHVNLNSHGEYFMDYAEVEDIIQHTRNGEVI